MINEKSCYPDFLSEKELAHIAGFVFSNGWREIL